jgi:hypothetical protein
MVELTRFDEDENPDVIAPGVVICTPINNAPVLPETSLINVDDASVLPPSTNGAVAGWMYMNLDHCNRDTHMSQNWVVSSMRSEDRYSVDIEALALGNGCTAPIRQSEAYNGELPIGPAPNVRP